MCAPNALCQCTQQMPQCQCTAHYSAGNRNILIKTTCLHHREISAQDALCCWEHIRECLLSAKDLSNPNAIKLAHHQNKKGKPWTTSSPISSHIHNELWGMVEHLPAAGSARCTTGAASSCFPMRLKEAPTANSHVLEGCCRAAEPLSNTTDVISGGFLSLIFFSRPDPLTGSFYINTYSSTATLWVLVVITTHTNPKNWRDQNWSLWGTLLYQGSLPAHQRAQWASLLGSGPKTALGSALRWLCLPGGKLHCGAPAAGQHQWNLYLDKKDHHWDFRMWWKGRAWKESSSTDSSDSDANFKSKQTKQKHGIWKASADLLAEEKKQSTDQGMKASNSTLNAGIELGAWKEKVKYWTSRYRKKPGKSSVKKATDSLKEGERAAKTWHNKSSLGISASFYSYQKSTTETAGTVLPCG